MTATPGNAPCTKRRQRKLALPFTVTPKNGDRYEVDVFMLVDGETPICIECKSGEFRQNLERYQALKKRLGLEARLFVMCIAGLEDDKAKAYSAMYELSFVNEQGLASHLARLF